MSQSLLGDLPEDDPLRNTALIDIGAEYRWKGGGPWKAVTPNYKIARNTYNDLGPAQTQWSDWRATEAKHD